MSIGLYILFIIYGQRGLRHCLSLGDGRYQSLIRGMSDETRFPRFFMCLYVKYRKSGLELPEVEVVDGVMK